jgi:hypothetical protein
VRGLEEDVEVEPDETILEIWRKVSRKCSRMEMEVAFADAM